MRLSDTFLTATQNLGRRKVRTVLTSIGVFVGILTVVTMVSLGVGIQQQVTDTIKQLGLQTVFVTPRLSGTSGGTVNVTGTGRIRPAVPLNNDAVAKIGQVTGVISVEVMLSLPTPPGMTVTIDGKTLPLSLADRSPQANLFEQPTTFLAGNALPGSADARGIVLGGKVLQSAGYTDNDLAGLVGKAATITVTAPRGEQQTFDTTIVGVSQGFNPAQLGNADKLAIKEWWYNDPNILETDGYSAAIVHTDSLNSATVVSRTIQDDMGFDSATLQTFLDQVNRIFSILQVMLSSIGLLALFVASIGIVNTMIMAIYERTREIGILKALGSSNGEILRMFTIEAGLIGLLGGIVGVVLGWGLGVILNAVIRGYFKSQQVPIDAPFFVVTPELVLAALAFATFVGVVAGLYPAFRAARLNPLAALRHE
ncbi:MAG TPA: ABC transporter permease [Chloroflexia bacterium]|nr:ABC transporter permease [Chloroflexia bacterium]